MTFLNGSDELEQFSKANLQHNLLFAAELLRLLAEFRNSGIPVAAFKGVVLAESLYGDLSLREFCDLDLIVHAEDMFKAEDVIAACGYRARFPDRDFRSAFLSYQGQYLFCHHRSGVYVDLHWRLASRGVAFPLDMAEVWPRLGQVTIANRSVPTFGRGDARLRLRKRSNRDGLPMPPV